MRDPNMEEIFGAIEEGSPFGEAVEELLEEGLAVEDAELDAATDAVLARLAGRRRRWTRATLLVLPLAAAAMGWVMLLERPDAEAPGRALVAGASPSAVSAPPSQAPSMAAAAEAADCLEALKMGRIDEGLALFDPLLEGGELSAGELEGLVQALHELGREAPTDDPQRARLLEAADRGYRAWLGAFGQDARAGRMHCAYGELLTERARFEDAYSHYSASSGSSEGTASCGQSALQLAERMLQDKPGKEAVDPSPGASVWEEHLVEAIDRTLTLDPDHPDGTGLAYKAAFTLYETGEHERAIDWFQDVLDRDPSSQEARLASHLILDSYAKQEDWTGLEEWALSFHEDEEVGDAADREMAFKIASQAGRAALNEDSSADDWLAWIDRYGEEPEVVEQAVEALRAEGRAAEADALEGATAP